MTEYKHEYIMSSERAYRRNDEERNTIYSNKVLQVGDVIWLDGIRWFVDEVIK